MILSTTLSRLLIRFVPAANGNPAAHTAVQTNRNPHIESESSSVDLKQLLIPRIRPSNGSRESTGSESVHTTFRCSKPPIHPFPGPPPSFINAGYSLTRIDAPDAPNLPEDLHKFSLGLAWMRRIRCSHPTWKTTAVTQLRGGVFTLYRPRDEWNFAFGRSQLAATTFRSCQPTWNPRPALRIRRGGKGSLRPPGSEITNFTAP